MSKSKKNIMSAVKLATRIDDPIMFWTEILKLAKYKRSCAWVRVFYTAYFAFIPMSLPPEALQLKFAVSLMETWKQEQISHSKNILNL